MQYKKVFLLSVIGLLLCACTGEEGVTPKGNEYTNPSTLKFNITETSYEKFQGDDGSYKAFVVNYSISKEDLANDKVVLANAYQLISVLPNLLIKVKLLISRSLLITINV